jgi:dipeptidyl aminopeptidase/acylaminoacyl peptidase
VAGGPSESIFQPEWAPSGDLIFASDQTGWWNLYRWREGQIEALLAREAEFGQPQWVFGMSTYAFAVPNRLACAYNVKGTWRLGYLDLDTLTLQDEDLPFTQIGRVVADNGRLAFIGSSPVSFASVVELQIATGNWEVLQRASTLALDDGYLSLAETIEFPTTGGHTAFGFYYPPKNQEFEAPAGERPPLIVSSHGGPTSAVTSSLSLFIQYFTSRGLGYLDVNYGGSTGYGREYRDRLKGQWGVVDVDDCVNGALFLARQGLVDEARLAIRGGSAGGYTTLSALTFRSVFRAGSSHYGISDLEAMVQDTHKFESRYLDGLIGPYPERLDLYRERSPIYHVDNLSCALIVFQGLEDKIVPPNQAEMIVDALRRKGLPVAYLPFEGEQHGFRRAENLSRAMEAELYFYGRVFGFEPADPLTPVEIENLA